MRQSREEVSVDKKVKIILDFAFTSIPEDSSFNAT